MGLTFTVQKMTAYVPVSLDVLFDTPRMGIVDAYGVQWVAAWPLWLVKEWFKCGNGMGRIELSCRWPRPTHDQLRQERIDRNAWLKSLDEDDE